MTDRKKPGVVFWATGVVVVALVASVAVLQSSLYTDDEIRRIIETHCVDQSDYLDVVPVGESGVREKVFRDLGIDERRVCQFRLEGPMNMGAILRWRVSPSFDISCVTATDDPENNGLDFADGKRRVYGIRFAKCPFKMPIVIAMILKFGPAIFVVLGACVGAFVIRFLVRRINRTGDAPLHPPALGAVSAIREYRAVSF